jgi:hypothetical protein
LYKFRLQKFAKLWLEKHIAKEKYKERIWSRWERWGEMMQKAFQRPQCGYFDPENPSKPDPEPHKNHKLDKGRRIRRNDDLDPADDDYDWTEMTDEEWRKVNSKYIFIVNYFKI